MTDSNLAPSQHAQLSNTFWLSLIPVFGSLAVVRTANRLGDRKFVQLGWAVFALSVVLAMADGLVLSWLLQIGLAIWLRQEHVNPLPPPLAKIDFNGCSKHELVRILDLPIVYANDIDLARSEGYIFTHAEEIAEIAGVPEEQVRRIAPRLVFAYDAAKDGEASWRRINFLSASEMEAFGIAPEVAQTIVKERLQGGDYRSAIAVKKRTGLSLRTYQKLL